MSLAVLEALLAPYVSSGRLVLLRRTRATGADVQGDRVRAVEVQSLEDGRKQIIEAPYFIDATELGDLLPLTVRSL